MKKKERGMAIVEKTYMCLYKLIV